MPRHEHHHFIPAFLLRGWESGSDKRLTVFAWKHGDLKSDRHKAKQVAKRKNLYSLSEGIAERRNIVESMVFQNLDDQAAKVHGALISDGPLALHPNDRRLWTHFIMSMFLRTPWEIEKAMQAAPEVLAETRRKNDLAGLPPLKSADEIDLQYIRDLTLFSTTEVLANSTSHPLIYAAPWAVINLSGSTCNLVIGDRAVFREGPLDEEFAIALPLSPTRLFVISTNGLADELGQSKPKHAVQRANRTAVDQAHEHVFATDDKQRPLVAKYLKQPIVGGLGRENERELARRDRTSPGSPGHPLLGVTG